jgi:hypothetical protein
VFYGANTTVGSPTVFGASPNNLINFFGVFNGSFIGDGSKLTNLAWGGFSNLIGANIAGNVLTISPGGGGFYFSSPVSLSGNNEWTGYNTWDQYMVANGYTVNGGVDISIGAAYGIQADGNIIAGTGAGPGVSTNYIQSVGDIFAGYSGGPSQNISATGDITAAGSLYAITNVVATEKIQAGTSITCGANGSGQFNGNGGGLTNVPVSAITGGSHTGYTDNITVPINLHQDPDTMELSWDTFEFQFVNGILISS